MREICTNLCTIDKYRHRNQQLGLLSVVSRDWEKSRKLNGRITFKIKCQNIHFSSRTYVLHKASYHVPIHFNHKHWNIYFFFVARMWKFQLISAMYFRYNRTGCIYNSSLNFSRRPDRTNFPQKEKSVCEVLKDDKYIIFPECQFYNKNNVKSLYLLIDMFK